MFANQHQSIGTNAKTAVARLLNLVRRQMHCSVAVVDHHEVVACRLVFDEWNFHVSWKLVVEVTSPLRSRRIRRPSLYPALTFLNRHETACSVVVETLHQP